jgi:ribonuclease HI
MKYTNSIVLGALLGTLSQIEYADAIRLTSDSQLEVELAKEHKKKHHKHHKKSKKNDLI